MKKRLVQFGIICLLAGCVNSSLSAMAGIRPEDFQIAVNDEKNDLHRYNEQDQKVVEVVPVYEFYSSYMKDYLMTASEKEKDALIDDYNTGRQTYEYKGIAGYVDASSSSNNLPVYRFWNEKTTDHFYTTSEQEKSYLEQTKATGEDDYVYEGIAWYVPESSLYAVYRLFDVESFNHYYTDSVEMKDLLAKEYLDGKGNYRYEGVAWYWYN